MSDKIPTLYELSVPGRHGVDMPESDVPFTELPADEVRAAYRQIEDTLHSIPGVESESINAGARPMEMRGRAMEGYIYVDPPALTAGATQEWLRVAIAFVQTLPPKASGSKPARKKGKP